MSSAFCLRLQCGAYRLSASTRLRDVATVCRPFLASLLHILRRVPDAFDCRRGGDRNAHDTLTLRGRSEVLVGLGEAGHVAILPAKQPGQRQVPKPRKAKGPGERTEAQTPARNPQPTSSPVYPRPSHGAIGSAMR